MFQRWLISATASVATEHPQQTNAIALILLASFTKGNDEKNALNAVVRSHCMYIIKKRVTCVRYFVVVSNHIRRSSLGR